MNQRQRCAGFTLLELAVVVVLIGILSGLGVMSQALGANCHPYDANN